MKHNKILNIENIGEVIENEECLSYGDFFKLNILDVLRDMLDIGEEYNFTLEDIEGMADNLLNNDKLFSLLDNFIVEEMNNYKQCQEEL